MAGSEERGQPPDAFALCSSYSNLPLIRITPDMSRMLGVDLDGSRRIEPAHVGRRGGPDGSRRRQSDRRMIIGMIQGHPTQDRMARRATPDAWWTTRSAKVAGPSGKSFDAAGSGSLLVGGGGLSWLIPGVTLCLLAGSSRRESCSSEILR